MTALIDGHCQLLTVFDPFNTVPPTAIHELLCVVFEKPPLLRTVRNRQVDLQRDSRDSQQFDCVADSDIGKGDGLNGARM